MNPVAEGHGPNLPQAQSKYRVEYLTRAEQQVLGSVELSWDQDETCELHMLRI